MVTRARDPGPLAREIEHTADLGLEVEAPSLGVLFERAGLGMLGLRRRQSDLDRVAAEEGDRAPVVPFKQAAAVE